MAFRSPTLRSAVGFVALAALVAASPAALSSQAPPAPELFSLNVVTVQPGMMRAYVDLQKAEVIPALQKGGQAFRETWRAAVFGDAFMFAHVAPISGFDQYDGQGPIIKALGQDGSAALLAKLRPMIATQKMYAMRTRPDLSFDTDGADYDLLADHVARRAVHAHRFGELKVLLDGGADLGAGLVGELVESVA